MDYKHWGVVPTDSDGIVWLYLNVDGEAANVLSREVLEELDHILQTISHWSLDDDGKTIRNGVADINGIVFMSGKDNGFIAGADVKEFTKIETDVDALQLIKFGQNVMDKIEQLSCPTVAVINGFCLGGGLELALACDYRIGLKDPKTKLGFPEVKLGIHPGFGGTVRSIELLGPYALQLMLTGRTLNAYQAKKLGLLDYVVAEQYLQICARDLIKTKPKKHTASTIAKIMNSSLVKKLAVKKVQKDIENRVNEDHYPAPYALLDLWESFTNDRKSNFDKEAQSVAKLVVSKTSRNLVRVFMFQNKLKILGNKESFKPKHVHVVGGGLMGGDIAIWCALQGFYVTVQDVNTKSLGGVVKRATKLFTKKLRQQHLVTAALDRLILDTQGDGIKKADVIIEAIFEDVEAKQRLFERVEKEAKPEALIATNTSSILLETLTENFKHRERLVGIHFFNPVARMPLVEVIHIPNVTDQDVIFSALSFVRHIDKLPLLVKSSPGFLVNRILTPYLLEAAILESEGVPKQLIDKAVTDFGMPMGPIELMDTIGLDVTKRVGDLLGKEYGFTFPNTLQQKIDVGELGRKTGKGFYEYKNGKPVKKSLGSPSAIADRLVKQARERLIDKLVETAEQCLKEGIVEDADMIDAGVIFGTGFAPFRGGPLHYKNK